MVGQRVAWLLVIVLLGSVAWSDDLTQWKPQPIDWKGAVVATDNATLHNNGGWAYLVAPGEATNLEISATVTITEPAKQFGFFGSSWSAWPDRKWSDQGFEAAVLMRGHDTGESGYRVQLSHTLQQVAIVKFPDGGYLRSVPCEVKLNAPMKLIAKISGNALRVSVDGKELISLVDHVEPLSKAGLVGIGTSSAAKVAISDAVLKRLGSESAETSDAAKIVHQPNFKVRKWLGGRQWVFDGDEPILQLHHVGDPSCFAKLIPGYKPQLTFDSHWGLENQGAFPEAASRWTDPETSGGGNTVQATWSARNVKDRFVTRSTLIVGFDRQRGSYTYDIASELEVLPGEPFYFRYGFDFEHHTPLDPFNWQYLIARKRGGELYHRPVYPIDPGPQNDLEPYMGVRAWHGRHNFPAPVQPAIEYQIEPGWNVMQLDGGKTKNRVLNTAVCAAFYDTGISFEPETMKPGMQVRVKYRYTGYPTSESAKLFEQSKIYASPTLDPAQFYIFADEWPKLTFSKFLPMSQSWIYGRTPFMTAHNTRPTYELEPNCGAGSGFAMKLGPASFGKANWPMPEPLSKGRYALTALMKAVNTHGPGARIELEAAQAKTNKIVTSTKHFVGNGSFDWKKIGFAFDVPEDAAALSVAFGNSGTGDAFVTDVELRRLPDGAALPADVVASSNEHPPKFASAPLDALADFRMQEGKGFHVLNYAGGDHLHLANLTFVTDGGRPALRFADNTTGRAEYRRDSSLARSYLDHPAYADKGTLPVATSGHHGGGQVLKGLTLAAWIKPAAEMGKSSHGGKGDIIGYGARRFILSLHGQKAPYQLAARLNVNDSLVAKTTLDAERWYHVAMTCEPHAGQWQTRLFVDGQPVAEGLSTKLPADSAVPHSIILGAEIFYLHDAYYRGLIGHSLVINRSLSASEISALMK